MVIDISYAVLAFCAGMVIGFVLGRLLPKNMGLY